ncbi:hypothetical protein FQR65_LT15411 [Abscondita terminalis]|nr:hypothetical protein FQR65_LT15411 [Abscondita terminalis]
MDETATITCIICAKELIENERFVSRNNNSPVKEDLSIDEHSLVCNKCKTETKTYQLCVPNENISANIKQELMENEGFINEDCILFNTDMLICIQEPASATLHYCFHCNYSTNNKDNLKEHIFSHCLKCKECSYSTFDGFSMRTHAEIHANLKRLYCKVFYCKEIPFLKSSFMKSTDSNTVNDKSTKVYKCKQCKFSTITKSDLKLHSNIHISKSTLKKRDEMRGCMKKKRIKCDLCNYRCNDSTQLKYHSYKHSGDWPFRKIELTLALDPLDVPMDLPSLPSTSQHPQIEEHQTITEQNKTKPLVLTFPFVEDKATQTDFVGFGMEDLLNTDEKLSCFAALDPLDVPMDLPSLPSTSQHPQIEEHQTITEQNKTKPLVLTFPFVEDKATQTDFVGFGGPGCRKFLKRNIVPSQKLPVRSHDTKQKQNIRSDRQRKIELTLALDPLDVPMDLPSLPSTSQHPQIEEHQTITEQNKTKPLVLTFPFVEDKATQTDFVGFGMEDLLNTDEKLSCFAGNACHLF